MSSRSSRQTGMSAAAAAGLRNPGTMSSLGRNRQAKRKLLFRHQGFQLLAGYVGWYVRHHAQPRRDKRRAGLKPSPTPPEIRYSPNRFASPVAFDGGGQTNPKRGGQVGVRSASRLRILCIRPAHPNPCKGSMPPIRANHARHASPTEYITHPLQAIAFAVPCAMRSVSKTPPLSGRRMRAKRCQAGKSVIFRRRRPRSRQYECL